MGEKGRLCTYWKNVSSEMSDHLYQEIFKIEVFVIMFKNISPTLKRTPFMCVPFSQAYFQPNIFVVVKCHYNVSVCFIVWFWRVETSPNTWQDDDPQEIALPWPAPLILPKKMKVGL